MKNLQSPLTRILVSILLGVLLIAYPNTTLELIVMIIGAFFLIPSLFSIILYFRATSPSQEIRSRRPQPSRSLPLESVGGLLLGLTLIILPNLFVGFLMYLLGALLVIMGVYQLLTLAALNKRKSVHFIYFLMPMAVTIAGVVVLFNPLKSAHQTLMLFGIAILVYSLSELINYLSFRKQLHTNR